MKSSSSFLLALLTQTALGGENLPAPSETRRGWSVASISAGAAWRSFGRLNYRGSSRSQNFTLPNLVGGDSLSIPAIGSLDAFADRTYDDGYVNQDAATASSGDTWFWGYQSSGQVVSDTLQFNATGSRSGYSVADNFRGGFSGDDRLENFSPQIDLVLTPPSTLGGPFDGLLVSFWAFGDDSNQQYSNFSASQNRSDFRLDFTDSYDISQITPLIGAPYNGSTTGPGPLLSNRPFDRERIDVLIGGSDAILNNSIATSLDLDGYSLALGPTLGGSFADQWSWQASAGFTFNIFNWSARESEALTASIDGAPETLVQEWRDHNSGTDFRLGIYFKGDVIRDLTDQWFVKATLQAEMAESVEIRVGDSEYEFNPRGYSVGLMLGRRF